MTLKVYKSLVLILVGGLIAGLSFGVERLFGVRSRSIGDRVPLKAGLCHPVVVWNHGVDAGHSGAQGTGGGFKDFHS